MTTFTVTETLETMRCPSCGMVYAMPQAWKERLFVRFNRGEKDVQWYCPQGHVIVFTSESELDRIRRERDQLKQDNARLDEIAMENHREAVRVQKELKRQARRAAAGVCPCCHRTFSQLARHMATEHPDQIDKTLGKRQGGLARAQALTPARRSEIARAAANSRWNPKLVKGGSDA